MKTKEEILKEHYFEYYKDTFPTDEQARKWSEIGLLIKEEAQAVYDAMEEYGKQQWNEAIESAAKTVFPIMIKASRTPADFEKAILKLKK